MELMKKRRGGGDNGGDGGRKRKRRWEEEGKRQRRRRRELSGQRGRVPPINASINFRLLTAFKNVVNEWPGTPPGHPGAACDRDHSGDQPPPFSERATQQPPAQTNVPRGLVMLSLLELRSRMFRPTAME